MITGYLVRLVSKNGKDLSLVFMRLPLVLVTSSFGELITSVLRNKHPVIWRLSTSKCGYLEFNILVCFAVH